MLFCQYNRLLEQKNFQGISIQRKWDNIYIWLRCLFCFIPHSKHPVEDRTFHTYWILVVWSLIKTCHHRLHTFRERSCSPMFKSPCWAKYKIYITLEYHMANDQLESMSGRGQVLSARGCNLISCYKSNRRLPFIWNLEPIIKTVNNSKPACYSYWLFICQELSPCQSCKLCRVLWNSWALPTSKVEFGVVRDLLYMKVCFL